MWDPEPQRALEMSRGSDAYLDSAGIRGGGSVAVPVPGAGNGLRVDPIPNPKQQSVGGDGEAVVQTPKSSDAPECPTTAAVARARRRFSRLNLGTVSGAAPEHCSQAYLLQRQAESHGVDNIFSVERGGEDARPSIVLMSPNYSTYHQHHGCGHGALRCREE